MSVLERFSIYETRTRFYIVASNSLFDSYRIAKLDRTDPTIVSFIEDPVVYSQLEMQELLVMISNGNKSIGGMKKLMHFAGIFGFVSFLEDYYLILITKKNPVALIGGHYIYHIDDKVMIPISNKPESKVNLSEQRYYQMFNQVDLATNFYFSYSYDITQSLQTNMTASVKKPNEMFVWNHYLTRTILNIDSPWFIPIIHGFVDQSKISVYGHNILVTLIARRSRHFAGARFLKRGVCDRGYVANDVETEQIVNDQSTTTFSIPCTTESSKSAYTSFLQHRGSIPLYWSQENSSMAAKPLIQVDYLDPYYSACAKHFNDLFKRYGDPIIVLNLVKSKEKVKRESLLLTEFTNAITFLNQTLPKEKNIKYIAWDMARASKSDEQDVIGTLEKLALQFLQETSFFHSGKEPFANTIKRVHKNIVHVQEAQRNNPSFQNGIVRTNCIDCLDRTNAAQFVIGKCALGYQLHALGVIPEPKVPFDSEAINIFNAMYHDHGDTIALQYGGSHLVNTMETYRKMSAWTSHSRDMIESIKRYYSNSFTDAEKQDAINLFLGNFIPKKSSVNLWDLTTDFEMHNSHPSKREPIKSYVQWWDNDVFKNKNQNRMNLDVSKQVYNDLKQLQEYYNPNLYTSIDGLFAFKMISTNPVVSSFTPRTTSANSSKALIIYNLNIGGVRKWLRPTISTPIKQIEESKDSIPPKPEIPLVVNTTSALVSKLLDPQVLEMEKHEYAFYCEQFKSKKNPTSQISFDLDESESLTEHPEYDFFLNYSSQIEPLLHEEKDGNVYNQFILAGDIDYYFGMESKSNDLSKAEGYHHWIETGFYGQVHRSKKKFNS